MHVNSSIKRFIRSKTAVLFCMAATIMAVFFIATSFTKRSKDDLLLKRVNLTIREIGDHLLLQAGDSTSRVLPVKEISDGVFLLEFENEFVFKPDTLVALTQRFLAKTNLPPNYTVTVYECDGPEIVYGFQISPKSDSIMACQGRSQPRSCYTIQIAFGDLTTSLSDYSSLGPGLSGQQLYTFSWCCAVY
jgi:hypothetical protein